MSKLDMSLDEISKKTNAANKAKKKTKKKTGKKGNAKKGKAGRGGKRGGRRGGKRGRGRGRGGRRFSSNGPARRNRNQYRKTPYVKATNTPKITVSTSIAITNLDPTVTEDDVREIFQKIGKVKSAIVHYDANGRSRGSARVNFTNKTHAIKAVNEYHQAEVDGRPMYVKAVAGISGSGKGPVVKKKQNNNRRGRGKRGRGRGRGGRRSGSKGARGRSKSKGGRGGRKGRGRGRGRGRGKGGRKPTPSKTAEQLDKEMEEYHAGGSSSSVDSLRAGQPDTSKLFSGEGEN